MSEFKNLDGICEELKIVWTQIVQELKSDEEFKDLVDVIPWMETVLESNVPFGKQSRATAIVIVYRQMVQERNPEDDFRVFVMGWILEVLHTFALIADDIMDNSKVRRGKPAWHTRTDVGMSAINDALLLENLTWRMLRKYFHSTPFYEPLLFLLQDTALVTILGQSLDTRFSIEGNFSRFTKETYDTIVKYKTSIYSFNTPVAIGMILSGITDKQILNRTKEILCEIGRLFQIQDDYLDLYGDPKVTGKVGTDISDRKCSWMIVEALDRGSIEQKAILQECYGSKKIDEIEKVEAVYRELRLKEWFKKHEVKTYDKIRKEIKLLEPCSLRSPIQFLLDAIYKRQK